ncbi:MAG: CHAD domain-containing protein [Sulfurimonas sp.]
MAALEIERKFLLLPCKAKKLLKFHHIPYRKERLEQFYVSTEASPYTRYRKKGNTCFQTIKTGEGLVRRESEHEVAEKEYREQRIRPLGRIIIKDRYTFEYENNLYEMDIFKGALKGLCYLEIEFEDEETAKDYRLPKIFETLLVAEVTYDSSFNNSALSNSETFPAPELEHTFLDGHKTYYRITPFIPVSHAMNTMIYLLTEEIKTYRETLLENPGEIEALHQFRIHMRKLRALLQEFETFFDPAWVKTHKKVLATLMEETNAKRDNDVAIADVKTFKQQFSSKDRKFLNELKDSMQKKEEKLKRKLTAFMSGPTLSTELETLGSIFKNSDIYPDLAKQPLILIAIGVIDKRIREIIAEGKHLKEKDKKAYHKLRIQFKKLRYLLELLSPIIPPDRLENTLTHLKKIQTILGEINDLQVQKRELKAFDQKKKSKGQKSLKSLQKKMKAREKKQLAAFKEAFKVFKKEKSIYQKLLFL